MDKITKFLDFDVKKVDGEPSTYWFTASTEDRDREGDVIVQSAWKLQGFKKNPVILYGHDYSGTPIGRAKEVTTDGGKLRAKIEFVPGHIDEFSGKVSKLVEAGFLKTLSVGFMAYKREPLTDDDKKQRPDMGYGSRLHGELLEISVVPVPANPMAMRERAFGELAMKSFGSIPEKPEEKESPYLPVKNAAGEIDGNMIRASMAALLGARVGVPVPVEDRKACANLLRRIAKEKGVSLPEYETAEEAKLKEEFKDVWHNELLDVIQLGMEETDKAILPLLKGETRQRVQSMVNFWNVLLNASDEKQIEPEPQKPDAVEEIMKGIIEIIKEIKAKA